MYYLQVSMIAASVVMPSLAALAVAARFQARRVKNLPFAADDWTTLLAWIIMTSDCIGCIYAVIHAGVGQLLITITPIDEINYFKFLYADIILDHLTYGIIKMSIILFYKRVFNVPNFRLISNIALGIVGAWTIAAVLSAIFSARPISNFWNEFGHTTYNFGVWNITMSALDITLDIMVLCLPLPMIRNLKISTRRKISLLGIFWLGLFCVAASVVRLYYSVQVIPITNDPMYIFLHPVRATYVSNANTLWARIEAGSSIIAACLPTIAPLVKDFKPFGSFFTSLGSLFPRTFSTSKGSRQDSDASKNQWLVLGNGTTSVVNGKKNLTGENTDDEESQIGSQGKNITVQRTVTVV